MCKMGSPVILLGVCRLVRGKGPAGTAGELLLYEMSFGHSATCIKIFDKNCIIVQNFYKAY